MYLQNKFGEPLNSELIVGLLNKFGCVVSNYIEDTMELC